ncbi:DUF2255 family protein [Agrococcus baldri]|uniref:DUF2255 domain-containing protein n=1 Tax=Agrococcus baldri TaxID=153730 RepID=A0AA87RKG3_9MICO|nr:DUF2255 family protein [Agrococcus baldri]GEK80823.1 hypothetical protein ABA31_21740 [Agrococcus baldri]
MPEQTATEWTKAELDELHRVGEIRVAGSRRDGSLRTLTIVWHVVVDGMLYTRSVHGDEGQWYRGVLRQLRGAISWSGQTRDVVFAHDDSRDDAIDAAYFEKYGRGSASQSITSDVARATTLRVDPVDA